MKRFVIFLTLITSFIQASEPLKQQTWITKALEAFSQSRLVHAYSNHVQTKIDGFMHHRQKYGNELASQKYQDLGLEAQKTIGIPTKQYLPIFKIHQDSPAAKTISAVAESDGIYVSEDIFGKMPYGSQRSTMFHESVHAKHHDSAIKGVSLPIGFLSGSIGTHSALKALQIVTLRKSLSCGVGLLTSFALSFKYRQFMEQRADIQGHYATNCSNCVLEEVQNRTNKFESALTECLSTMPVESKKTLQDTITKLCGDRSPTDLLENFECCQGYLHRSDLQKIAQDLGDKKCTYHDKYPKGL